MKGTDVEERTGPIPSIPGAIPAASTPPTRHRAAPAASRLKPAHHDGAAATVSNERIGFGRTPGHHPDCLPVGAGLA